MLFDSPFPALWLPIQTAHLWVHSLAHIACKCGYCDHLDFPMYVLC